MLKIARPTPPVPSNKSPFRRRGNFGVAIYPPPSALTLVAATPKIGRFVSRENPHDRPHDFPLPHR